MKKTKDGRRVNPTQRYSGETAGKWINDIFLRNMFYSKRFHEVRVDKPYSKRYEVVANKYQHTYWKYIQYCIDCAKNSGLWMEFGVATGNSARYICANIDKTYYGFDSFKGLPNDWVRHDGDTGTLKGAFNTNGKYPHVPHANFKLVEGWYEDTLDQFLLENPEPCAFVHIDCDLYSSTNTVLECLYKHGRLVPGTVIIFDEFYGYDKYTEHEYKAFRELVNKYNIHFNWLAHTTGTASWNGEQAAAILK